MYALNPTISMDEISAPARVNMVVLGIVIGTGTIAEPQVHENRWVGVAGVICPESLWNNPTQVDAPVGKVIVCAAVPTPHDTKTKSLGAVVVSAVNVGLAEDALAVPA